MSDWLVYASIVMLIVSKIPDFVTTWKGIQETENPDLEQNPIARTLFHAIGVGPAFVVLALVYLGLSMLNLWIYSQMSVTLLEWSIVETLQTGEWISSILIFGTSILISITQVQAAIYNQTGRMYPPLKQIYRWMQWFYTR